MRTILLTLLAAVLCMPAEAQGGRNALVAMFYNTENLFHPSDDPDKNDEEFTPAGRRHWTDSLYRVKCRHISTVVTAAAVDGSLPAVVGLCEVECRRALDDVLSTPDSISRRTLAGRGYRVVHYESPDRRGIDVALFYDSTRVALLSSRAVRVSEPERKFFTRDLLYAELLHRPTADTVHFVVCHWPSKLGGAAKSEGNRRRAAMATRSLCDSIGGARPGARIVVMGDFNDGASSEAITGVLGAHPVPRRGWFGRALGMGSAALDTVRLVNLSADTRHSSYKYNGQWETIDHIMVSAHMCRGRRPVYEVVRLPFLLEEDYRFSGQIPYRTYRGQAYRGGYSDHLPVRVSIALP